MNTFGERLKITTFGESHGTAIGCVIDGLPAGLKIDMDFINDELDRRKGGKNKYSTMRKEADIVEIISGVFEGYSTGTPIGIMIANNNTKKSDYENIKSVFRPSHADFTYFYKYGIRDYRGGGRSSARESVARVASGAVAKLFLREFGITTRSGICQIGTIKSNDIDFAFATTSEIFALDSSVESAQKEAILMARKSHDSIGGVALISAIGVPVGLGEPLYYKLDSAIGSLMLGLNGVKAVQIGDGMELSSMHGSMANDCIDKNGFMTNHSGGVLGGISNGDEIVVKVYFKPTPSIFLPQQTIDMHNNETILSLKGRHDPCIAVRGSVVAESMLSLILSDMLLINATANMDNVRKVYR